MSLQGKTAIVTGGATGLGAATCRLLAEKGANVVVNYSKSEAEATETSRLCAEFGVKSMAIRADVSQKSECLRLVESANTITGRVDILVNNAAKTKFIATGDLDQLSGEDYMDTYRLIVVGAYEMIRACVPGMRATGKGAIVNITSVAALFGGGSSPAYAAAKGALITFTKSMARALGPDIRVNAVCPGFMATRWLTETRSEEAYDQLVQMVTTRAPLKRAALPEDVAQGVVFLCSDAAVNMTGVNLIMDAGTHLTVA